MVRKLALFPKSSSFEEIGIIDKMIRYNTICLTAIGLTPGGSSTVHIYTQIISRTTQSTQTIDRATHFTN